MTRKEINKIIEEVKDLTYGYLYQEWVEPATPANFEAGKINLTAWDKGIEKYLKAKLSVK